MSLNMLAKAKVAKGGKISIPSACRKYLKLKDGEEIIFSINDNNDVVISPMRTALEKARKLINKYHDPNKSLVDELITGRRIEARNE
jgi:bifunctional DNA-binding transcriptional regulator/antitoxin component of YhaV-PrlF toxin-antitoxin module